MPHFDENGNDTYLCQFCLRVKGGLVPSLYIVGRGNQCPECQKKEPLITPNNVEGVLRNWLLTDRPDYLKHISSKEIIRAIKSTSDMLDMEAVDLYEPITKEEWLKMVASPLEMIKQEFLPGTVR